MISPRPDSFPEPIMGGLPHEVGRILPEAWLRTGVGFCLTDSMGVIRAVNPAFCDTTGYQPEELVGLSLLRLQPPEAAVASSAAHMAIIAGRTPTSAITYLHKSGRPLFAHITDTCLASSTGEMYRLTSLIDLERETRTEARLEQLQRAENFVALCSTISNDFNNVLAIIMGYTAFIQDGAGDVRRVMTAVQGIDNAVQRAADLIKQTLYLTRQTAPTLQRVDLSKLAEEMSRNAAANERWTLEVELALQDNLPPASLDPRHLTHVFDELCRKAVEGLGAGAHLRLSTMSVAGHVLQMRFSEAREPVYALLEARFAPSMRGGTLPSASPGWQNRRDLALVTVESIVASHRGCFEAVQLDGNAVAFRLYLPTLPDPAPIIPAPMVPATTATPPPLPASNEAGTVLVVDDEESLLHALGFALERHGYRVLKARDGLDAVETYRQHASRIQLVLCDLGLPRMSGWEAFMKMKDISPLVQVVVMSGHLEPTLHAEILRAGARGFLQKPFAIAKAVSTVQEIFSQANGSTGSSFQFPPVNR